MQRFFVLVRVVFGVLPVGDQKNNLAPFARAVLQLLRGGENRVVNMFRVRMAVGFGGNFRGSRRRRGVDARAVRHGVGADAREGTAEVDVLKLREKLVVVSDKIFRNLFGDLIEPPQRHFVRSAECSRQRCESFLNLFRGAALQVIVNQNGGRQRKCVRGKQSDRLLDAVLQDAEIGLLQVGHQFARTVLYRNRHNDQGDSRADSSAGILRFERRGLARTLRGGLRRPENREGKQRQTDQRGQSQHFSWTFHGCTVTISAGAASGRRFSCIQLVR